MEKELTPQEKAEKELADKIKPIIDEINALGLKRGGGVTLEKNQYIGERGRELEETLDKLQAERKKLKEQRNDEVSDTTEGD